ncbi:MAG: UvrB/UvrC motif-containing protein, partial [Ruminococcus sp.]|nr:UvrB/UvrC motif-containing protein [Ruminococcus sp.]
CKSELEQAIKSQEFEKAAELRDRIRELEKNFSSEGKE